MLLTIKYYSQCPNNTKIMVTYSFTLYLLNHKLGRSFSCFLVICSISWNFFCTDLYQCVCMCVHAHIYIIYTYIVIYIYIMWCFLWYQLGVPQFHISQFWHYLELKSDCTTWKVQCHKTAPISDTRCKSHTIHTFDQLAINWRLPWPPPQVC